MNTDKDDWLDRQLIDLDMTPEQKLVAAEIFRLLAVLENEDDARKEAKRLRQSQD